MRAALGDQLGPAARRRRRSDCPSPRRRATSPVEPGGRSQIARMCCSNCEVTAPSIVQWPLLWTRGAISLTTGPSCAGEEFDGQHADMAERLGDAQRGLARFGDLRGDEVAARHGRAAEDAFAMLVLRRIPEGSGGRPPSARRSPRIRRRSRRRLRRPRAPRRSRAQAASAVAVRADPGLALAVIAVAAGLEDERQAELGDRRVDVVEARDRAPRRDARAASLR